MSLIQNTINSIQPLHTEAMNSAQERLDQILKPQGSLGKLEDIAKQTAGITGKVQNRFHKKIILVMGSDNGIFAESIATSHQDISMLVADCMAKGTAGVSVLARNAGADVRVIDLGIIKDCTMPEIVNRKVRRNTHNFLHQHAMSREEAIMAIEIGIEETFKAIDEGYDLIGTGEIGVANTTTSSAILHVLTGEHLDLVVGRGAGLSDQGLMQKKEVIRLAVEKHQPDPNDPIDVLAKVGGFDIAALTGTYLASASRRVPVIVDGLISGVAALLAIRLNPDVINYIFPSHGSAEPGALIIQRELGLEPMLQMKMRLGEGTGCALAFHLMDAAMAMMNEQAMYKDIGL